MNRYILQGHKAVLVDRETYLNQQEEQDRRVANSTIGDYLVSTVFLGLDHQWEDDGPPLLFETMVFGNGPLNERQERCTTWEEAEAMHEKMCEEVRQQDEKVNVKKKGWQIYKGLTEDNLIGIQSIEDNEPIIAMVYKIDDARIIAAAPELLEALQRSTAFLEWDSKGWMSNDMSNQQRVIVMQSAKAAIAKATGSPYEPE